MKNKLLILLSGLLLCGCSQKQATSAGSAIDLVEAGKDITAFSGFDIRIAKRDGDSLAGVQIISTKVDGQKSTVTADAGTLSPGSIEDASDVNSVKLTLHNAHSETLATTGKMSTDFKEMTLVLKR